MSKIAFRPADTGSATFTLESPATNTNRTLTLPDEAGTIVTSAAVGTLSSQDANSVDIDGGNIDGTAIGVSSANEGNFTDLNASGQVIIPAGVTLGTAAGVYNADNTLDDYETGDWQPVLVDGSTGSVISDASIRSEFTGGKYTKIGRLVVLTGTFRLNSKGTITSGNLAAIGGFPFPSGIGSAASDGLRSISYISTGSTSSNIMSLVGLQVSFALLRAASGNALETLGNLPNTYYAESFCISYYTDS